MGSLVNFPSQAFLQNSLAQAVGTLPSHEASAALESARLVPGFGNLSSLNALASQDSFSRMVAHPALYGELVQATGVLGNLPAIGEALALPTLEGRLETFVQILDLRHGVQVFSARENKDPAGTSVDALFAGGIGVIGRTMSRALKDELAWPYKLALSNLGGFAVSIRRAYDAHQDHLDARQRFDLMRLACFLDEASADLCRYEEAEKEAPIKAMKLASLIETLFGSGFGEERALDASGRLYKLRAQWAKTDATARQSTLRSGGEEARNLSDEAKAASDAIGVDTPTAAATLQPYFADLGF